MDAVNLCMKAQATVISMSNSIIAENSKNIRLNFFLKYYILNAVILALFYFIWVDYFMVILLAFASTVLSFWPIFFIISIFNTWGNKKIKPLRFAKYLITALAFSSIFVFLFFDEFSISMYFLMIAMSIIHCELAFTDKEILISGKLFK